MFVEGGGSVEHQKYSFLEEECRFLVRSWRLGVYVRALSCLKLTPAASTTVLCEWSCGFGRVGGILEISSKNS